MGVVLWTSVNLVSLCPWYEGAYVFFFNIGKFIIGKKNVCDEKDAVGNSCCKWENEITNWLCDLFEFTN